MSRARSVLAALALAASWAVVPHASAYEERLELSIGFGPTLVVAADLAPGGAADVVVSRGISDRWSLGGSLRYSLNHRDSFEHRVSGSLDATWALDIVQWVPRLTVGVGPALGVADGGIRAGIVGTLRIGADRITEFGLIGFDLRLDSYGFLTDVMPGRISVGASFRVGWLFDRF